MVTHHADDMLQFLGSWSLVSWTATSTDGTVRFPLDEDPVGRIMYLPDGSMSAALMRRKRNHFASADRHAATAEERDAAYRDFLSYFGSFSVQADEKTVTHHVEGATFPNWVGTDLVRDYAFADGMLTLSLVRPHGTQHALKWKKISG